MLQERLMHPCVSPIKMIISLYWVLVILFHFYAKFVKEYSHVLKYAGVVMT